jgi:capsular polysaccharide transport system permease protein
MNGSLKEVFGQRESLEKTGPGVFYKFRVFAKRCGKVVLTIAILALLVICYWLVVASDRFVSETVLVFERTDINSTTGLDLGVIFSGGGGANRADQLLLREYLLSMDMMVKLDSSLDLRSHYSDRQYDIISRLWSKNVPIEWFYDYFLSRIDISFDDFSGVLHLSVQAFTPEKAKAIADLMLDEGERYMNTLGHELAKEQVAFLGQAVSAAQKRVIDASRSLLDFQNQMGLASPESTAESRQVIIATLEAQRTEIETKLASLPKDLAPNHPSIVMLKNSLAAVEQQIVTERNALASPGGGTLNYTIEAYQRLELEASFARDVYKTALVALEKGQMDATRTLKKVSVLQRPTLPEYPLKPRRIYNSIVSLTLALLLAGIYKLLADIIKDHVE